MLLAPAFSTHFGTPSFCAALTSWPLEMLACLSWSAHTANVISGLMITDTERARIRELARRTAADMPPLDAEQKAALRVLLSPVRVHRALPKPDRTRRQKPPDVT